jgi:hypothetical protein
MMIVAVAAWSAPVVAADDQKDFASFLELREIDQSRRSVLESATEWSDDAEGIVIKVLRRIDAPESLVAGWRETAVKAPAKGEPVAISDSLLSIHGRAIFVAPRQLPAATAELFGSPHYDVVRIVDDGGLVVDVLTRAAPAAWPRWKPINEPVSAIALPLTTTAAPQPKSAADDGQEWPAEQPAVVAAAARVGWHPDTLLGRSGMDYGLFDSVVDGKKLVAGDSAAFYAMLAAAGRTSRQEVATAAGKPIDAMLLIDPGRKWFPAHRGDPVIIEGDAMRATRVPIDEPFLRKFVGKDHYWEVFVFVETPLLDIDGHMQNSYPIVCCVRELPPGMPSGERISERVKVAGFALKRYAYPFEALRPDGPARVVEEPSRRLTTLLVSPELTWFPPASKASSQPMWVIAAVAAGVALIAIIGVGFIYGNRSIDQAIRKARQEFPDRVELPKDDG